MGKGLYFLKCPFFLFGLFEIQWNCLQYYHNIPNYWLIKKFKTWYSKTYGSGASVMQKNFMGQLKRKEYHTIVPAEFFPVTLWFHLGRFYFILVIYGFSFLLSLSEWSQIFFFPFVKFLFACLKLKKRQIVIRKKDK